MDPEPACEGAPASYGVSAPGNTLAGWPFEPNAHKHHLSDCVHGSFSSVLLV